jgi:DNA polymerase-3 subunit delta'
VQKLCRGGSHPDLHIITKELAAISRDPQVRNSKQTNIARAVLEEFLLEPAARTRIMLGESLAGKVFIIDEADLLDPRGQNTLLKTLEEPPAGTVIILVTSNEDRLLPTIRSRCQRVAFQPLDDAEMDAWFKTDAAAALRAADAAQLKWIRGFAAGAPGLARLAAEASLFDWHTTLAPLLGQLDKGQFPPDLGGTLAKLVSDRAEADVKSNPDASKDGANKVWGRRMLSFLAEAYRARLRAAAAASSDPDHPATQRWLACLDSIHAAEGHLASNVNLTMLFENLAAQLALEPALN